MTFTPTVTEEELLDAITAYLDSRRCTHPCGIGGSQPGMHGPGCCFGTGWDAESAVDLRALTALDRARRHLAHAFDHQEQT